MVTFATATKNSPSFPTRAPAQRRVCHSVANTCSVPNDSLDLFKAACRTQAQLVSPSRDPIGFAGSPWNAYRYVHCGPTNWEDPSGLLEPLTCTASASVLTGTVTSTTVTTGVATTTVTTTVGTTGVATVGTTTGATGATVGGGVLGTVVFPAVAGTGVGVGIYKCPRFGTQTTLQPWLTRLCYRLTPINLPPPPPPSNRDGRYPACCRYFLADTIGAERKKTLSRSVMCRNGTSIWECCAEYQVMSGIPPVTTPSMTPPYWFGDPVGTAVGNCPEENIP